MHLSNIPTLLALLAAIPFSTALPTAEADASTETPTAISAAAAAPYWKADFYERTTCDHFTGEWSTYGYNKASGCTNIILPTFKTPTAFTFDSAGVWKMLLYKKTDCKGEVVELGPGTENGCQSTKGVWPKRSFRVVRA